MARPSGTRRNSSQAASGPRISRTRAPGRLLRILDAAVEVFIRNGYRQGRIEDVAALAGVSPATVHLYARSKDALFDLAMRHALGDSTVGDEPLPYAAPPPAELIERASNRLRAVAVFPRLEAVATRRPSDPGSELAAIVREGYRWLLRYHRAVLLVERCAREWPELAALWYMQFRRGVLGRMAAYLARRGEQGALRATPDAAMTARICLETIAFFAMHRHRAPDSAMDDAKAEEAVVDFIGHALLPGA